MAIKRISPYIQCKDGEARKAIALYEKALGADVVSIMRFADVPKEMNMPPEQSELVMHAEIRIGEDFLMLSDAAPKPAAPNGNVQIILDFTDPDEMAKAYGMLSEAGEASMPIHDAFWGAKFGALTDPFGVRFLLHCEVKS
jgi:PhnB protein